MSDACRARMCDQLATFVSNRTVIVGIGNRQKGDDGLAPAVIDGLKGKVPVPLIDAGISPENFTQSIADLKPDTVLFVDAADINRQPGEMALYSADELVSAQASTHTGNIAILEKYICSMTGAKCLFLLVQPADVKYRPDTSTDDSGQAELFLSSAVLHAVELICRIIVSLFDDEQANMS